MYDAIIIGCGAAGMMAAITLAERHKKIIILEKNEKAGKNHDLSEHRRKTGGWNR